jgi:hypothetical protein
MSGRNEVGVRTLFGLGWIAVAAAAASGAGCATLAHGSMQSIAVSSTPDKASVLLNGNAVGVTPTTLRLERKKKDQLLRVELAGYQPYEVSLKRGTDGWFWGDIVLLSPLGVVIDASSGAMYKLSPARVAATLGKAQTRNDGDLLRIDVVLEADPTWQRIGSLVPVR